MIKKNEIQNLKKKLFLGIKTTQVRCVCYVYSITHTYVHTFMLLLTSYNQLTTFLWAVDSTKLTKNQRETGKDLIKMIIKWNKLEMMKKECWKEDENNYK